MVKHWLIGAETSGHWNHHMIPLVRKDKGLSSVQNASSKMRLKGLKCNIGSQKEPLSQRLYKCS